MSMTVGPREVGQRIAEARRRRGWTQLTFALQAGVTTSTVARWEHGALPPVPRLIHVATLLELDPAVLVGTETTSGSLETRVTALEKRVAALEAARD